MQSIGLTKTIELIWVKASLNLRSEASVNYLSYAWWVIEPLLHMVVYYVVFSLLLARGGDNYVAFLLTGLIPWLWFAKSISHAQGSIIGGKQLMNQLYVSKLFFPLTNLTQDAVKQGVVFVLLLAFLVIYGIHASVIWLWLIPIVLLQLLLTVGCALLAALLVPFIRDMTFVIPTGLQFMMFCSGIFFNPMDISPHLHSWFFLNPMAVILQNYRDVLINNQLPDLQQNLYVLVISLILISVSAFLYKKLDHVLPRVVLE